MRPIRVLIRASGSGVGLWLSRWYRPTELPASLPRYGNLGLVYANPVRYTTGPDGELEFLVLGGGDFANHIEAIQIALEQLAKLPDVSLFAEAALQVSVE